jgi:hypothetical protein
MGCAGVGAVKALVEETNRVDKIPKVSKLESDYFFSILDDDRSGSITKEEFFDVCDILQYSFTLTAQVVGILIVKEGLIVAFIVDAFLSQFEDNRALCEDENIASLDQSRAGEGFRIIASKRGTKDDIYRAMFLEDDD